MRADWELQELHTAYNKCEVVGIYGLIGMIGKCRVCGQAYAHYMYETPGVWHRISRATAAKYIRQARGYDRQEDRRLLGFGKRVMPVQTGFEETSRPA